MFKSKGAVKHYKNIVRARVKKNFKSSRRVLSECVFRVNLKFVVTIITFECYVFLIEKDDRERSVGCVCDSRHPFWLEEELKPIGPTDSRTNS